MEVLETVLPWLLTAESLSGVMGKWLNCDTFSNIFMLSFSRAFRCRLLSTLTAFLMGWLVEVVFDIEFNELFSPFPHRESNLQHLSVLELTDSSASVANKFGKGWAESIGFYAQHLKRPFATFALASFWLGSAITLRGREQAESSRCGKGSLETIVPNQA